jgi:hypothetical protein
VKEFASLNFNVYAAKSLIPNCFAQLKSEQSYKSEYEDYFQRKKHTTSRERSSMVEFTLKEEPPHMRSPSEERAEEMATTLVVRFDSGRS